VALAALTGVTQVAEVPPGLVEALRDRYRIERELGRGGMATVYLAEDVKHHRPVAVKVLHPGLAAAIGPARFLREIEVVAHLQHPHILPLHDSGSAGQFLYYVMPYVEGESLHERLSRERELPVPETIRILWEITDALAYAHAHGVVHRDIKPGNVMLSGRHALVTDFGVAKAVGESADREELTTAGLALGTPSYMAPEQAVADRQIDHRADLYSLGVLAYELLAGRPPFQGASAQQVVAAHVSQRPEELSRHRPAISPELEQIVMRCLEKRPADRWQHASEILECLEPLLGPGGARTPPGLASAALGHWAGRRTVWAAGGAALLALAAGIAFLTRDRTPSLQFGRRIQVTLDPGLEIDPAISPDGKLVAYAAGSMSDLAIHVRQVDGGSAIAVAPGSGVPQRFPFWPPDGKRIMFRSPRGIEIVPALGGPARVIVGDDRAPAPRGRSDVWGSAGLLLPGSWSPGGDRIAFARFDSLYSLDLEGGSPRLLAHGGEMHSFAWSPDGRWIACVRGNRQSQQAGFFFGNLGQGSIWLLPTTGGEPIPVTDDRSFNASPTWMPGGGALLFVSNRDGGLDLYRLALDRSGRPQGPADRLTTGLNAQAVGLSADGRRLAYSVFRESSNVWSLPIPATGTVSVRAAEPVTSGNQVVEGFDISPDGRWLGFDSDRSGNQDLYRVPLAGGEPEQLTADPDADFWPRWSPDGSLIAFHAFREGRRHLFMMNADGTGRRQVTRGPDDERTADWTADGQALVYLHNFNAPDTEIRVLQRTATGDWGEPRTLFRGDAFVPATSPRGRLVALASGGAIKLIDAAGDPLRMVDLTRPVPGGPRPAYLEWSPDGRTLYYLAVDSADRASIWSVSVNGGTPRQVVEFDDPARQWHRFGYGMRGGRFYFTLGDRQSDLWVTELETSH